MRAFAVLIPLGLIAAGILYLSTRRGEGVPPASPRPALSTICPKLTLRHNVGAQLVDYQLRNLGGGLFGESRLYQVNGRRFELHVGFDALEEYDDLDFLSRGAVTLGGRQFDVSRSVALNYSLWAATFQLDTGPERCREATAIGRGFTEQRFHALLAAITPD